MTRRPTRTAVIPVGYADGFTLAPEGPLYRLSPLKLLAKKYKRSLSVTIKGKPAPIIGRVSMQLCVADAKAARDLLMDQGVVCSEISVFDERDGGTFFGFADPDGNSWAVQQLKVRGEKPLIPHEHRGRFGAE